LIEATVGGTVPEVRENHTEAFQGIAQILERAIQLNFSAGGRLPSQRFFPEEARHFPWEPLKPPRSGTPLVATGRFYASVRSEFDSDSASVFAGGNFADIRIPMIHQKGGMAGRNHSARIPARPFMVLTDHDMDQIADKFLEEFIISKNF